MPCDCANRPEADILPDIGAFLDSLREERRKGKECVSLCQCLNCGQWWYVDWDRANLAIKLAAPNLFDGFDARPYDRELIIRRAGGLGDAICNWRGCTNRVLKGRKVCFDHAWGPVN
jgi:hypothetical protein